MNAPLRVPTSTRTPLMAHSYLGFHAYSLRLTRRPQLFFFHPVRARSRSSCSLNSGLSVAPNSRSKRSGCARVRGGRRRVDAGAQQLLLLLEFGFERGTEIKEQE